jgi:hypothetical protein
MITVGLDTPAQRHGIASGVASASSAGQGKHAAHIVLERVMIEQQSLHGAMP